QVFATPRLAPASAVRRTLPVAVSQTVTPPLSPPAATALPSGEKARHATRAVTISRTTLPEAISTTATPEKPPIASVWPSAHGAPPPSPPLLSGMVKDHRSSPLAASHRRTLSYPPTVASRVPSADREMPRSQPPCRNRRLPSRATAPGGSGSPATSLPG